MTWMMKHLAMVSTLVFLTVTTAVGQNWIEVGDAPADIPSRQDTVGVGPLTNIRGGTNESESDWVDVYSIVVTDPLEFYATTDGTFGNGTGTSTFDTRLFLFSEDGTPVIANDDLVNAAPYQSLITDPRTFPNAVASTAENITLEPDTKYLLAVTGWDNDPVDGAGAILFSDTGSISDSNIALHGPNPAAGAFAGWEDTGETGDYVVELGGATFCAIPEPGTMGLVGIGLLCLVSYRRR